jgi:hypothetical protein
MLISRDDSRYKFYKPFYDARRGIILVLASPEASIRDGLAVAELARCFPRPEYGIEIEPSRPHVNPAENLILVGFVPLHLDPDKTPASEPKPLGLGKEFLEDRFPAIDKACCFRFEGGENRFIRNVVTATEFVPKEVGATRVDYGVIRRFYRAHVNNTLIFEGSHRAGTLGVVKVATMQSYLNEIQEGIDQIPDFDSSLLVEILVRVSYEPEREHGIFSINTIKAELLSMVFNYRWRYDFNGEGWKDQLPWHIRLSMKKNEAAVAVPCGETPDSVPRLEIEADLSRLDGASKSLCERCLANGKTTATRPPRASEMARFLDVLSPHLESFRVKLIGESGLRGVRARPLPEGLQSSIRMQRKRFIVLSTLCRALGEPLQYDADTLRRLFPDLAPGRADKELEALFVNTIRGKLAEGFAPLMEPAHSYLHFEADRQAKTYWLRLDTVTLVLKLRL